MCVPVPAPPPQVAPTPLHAFAPAVAAAFAAPLLRPVARECRPEPERPAVIAPRGSSLVLHAAPGRPVVRRVGSRTEFGSPLRLPVVRRRGPWLGVVSSTLPDGRVGWVRVSRSVRVIRRARLRVVVDRSDGRLVVLASGRVVRRLPVGVGAAGTPTPTGHFAVTDKLDGSAFSAAAYGCCILTLSGHQSRLPAGWRGGNRLAIHGGPPGASSAGCLHAAERHLRWLMRRVPTGTLVTIRA